VGMMSSGWGEDSAFLKRSDIVMAIVRSREWHEKRSGWLAGVGDAITASHGAFGTGTVRVQEIAR